MLGSMTTLKLPIEGGRVSCPVRGNVDVELCFTCPELADLAGDPASPYVKCSPQATASVRGVSSIPWI